MKKLIILMLLAAPLLLSLSSCSKNNDNLAIPVKVNTYVIVPGAWQGPYAWDNVKTDLESAGNKVLVVELPGHGKDLTDPSTITLDSYISKVVTAVNGVNGQVVLVGHSLGGMVISGVAEKIPSKIQKLIYVGAYLPASGQALLDLAGTDAASLLGQSLINDPLLPTLGLVQANITDIFIGDGTAAEKALVLQNYRLEPKIPFVNPVTLTTANYGTVSKAYIHTLQDRAISMDLQTRMVTASGIKAVYQLNTSHSPFLSKPDSVATLLINIAK